MRKEKEKRELKQGKETGRGTGGEEWVVDRKEKGAGLKWAQTSVHQTHVLGHVHPCSLGLKSNAHAKGDAGGEGRRVRLRHPRENEKKRKMMIRGHIFLKYSTREMVGVKDLETHSESLNQRRERSEEREVKREKRESGLADNKSC